MSTIGNDLIALMNESLEEELVLEADGGEAIRLAIYARSVQLSSLRALERGEVVESCDPRSREERLAETRNRPWPELEREARKVVSALTEAVEQLSPDQLFDDKPWDQIDEPPLWRQLFDNCIGGPVTVVSEHLRDRGELDEAIRINERLRDRARTLALPPKIEAHAAYNLACLHAGAGRTGEALALLEDALRLNPGLVEWSRKDRDLDPIRKEATYAELTAA
jgi:tetratricopeptide (TPR) repeat protein